MCESNKQIGFIDQTTNETKEKAMNKQTARKPSGAAALGPGPGRPRGSVNKATKTFRETVTAMLEGNADNVQKWLETVAYGDGDQVKPDPKGALTLLAQLAEYATPKLARTELAGDQDAPIKSVSKVEYVIIGWNG
jgi:hypothetical protein